MRPSTPGPTINKSLAPTIPEDEASNSLLRAPREDKALTLTEGRGASGDEAVEWLTVSKKPRLKLLEHADSSSSDFV